MDNIYVRNEKIKKWVLARKGRVSLLAHYMELTKNRLYELIMNNRLTPEMVNLIELKQVEIESLEKQCIRRFEYFKRFAERGKWRIPKLAEKLNMNADLLRRLSKARGDSRYLLIKYGLQRVFNAIRECEKEKSQHFIDEVSISKLMVKELRRKSYTLKGIQDLACEVKKHASYGNHDSTVIFKRQGSKYKLLSVGFDSKHDDMCRTHVCEKDNPHIHATIQAVLNCPKNMDDGVGSIYAFAFSAPCPNCAKKLIECGVSRIYCYFEPEFPEGLVRLASHQIPVLKINVVTHQEIHINSEKRLKTINERD